MDDKRIEFHCRKCKKNLGMSYLLTGDNNVPVIGGIIMKCQTRKCMRTITFKKITEGDVIARADSQGRMYI